MAVSFIAAGHRVALADEPGVGDRETGLNLILDKVGLQVLENQW